MAILRSMVTLRLRMTTQGSMSLLPALRAKARPVDLSKECGLVAEAMERRSF